MLQPETVNFLSQQIVRKAEQNYSFHLPAFTQIALVNIPCNPWFTQK